jgi:type I restriction enzyme M protein
VSLDPTTFEGYGGRSATSILMLDKKLKPDDQPQGPTFLAMAHNTGYAPNGDPIPGNELPDILLAYQAFQRGEPIAPSSAGWTAQLDERLDAAYYEPQDSSPDIEGTSAHASETTLAFRNAESLAAQIRDWIPEFLATMEYDSVRLSDVLTEVREKVTIQADEIYRLLGVRWHGEGTFIREERLGQEIKADKLHRVARGNLVYNRLFAFRGSFAVVANEHHGACASGEFPMFTASSDRYDALLLLRYIAHFMNSPRTLRFVDAISTGSTTTSRNRFMQNAFLQLTVEVPKIGTDLSRVVQIMDAALDLSIGAQVLADDSRMVHERVGSLLPVVHR